MMKTKRIVFVIQENPPNGWFLGEPLRAGGQVGSWYAGLDGTLKGFKFDLKKDAELLLAEHRLTCQVGTEDPRTGVVNKCLCKDARVLPRLVEVENA